MDKEAGKKNAAREAARYLTSDTTIGLGTGSTAKYFVEEVGMRIAEGWRFRGVPTSEETKRLAEAVGIEIIDPDETTRIALAVDGADEADPELNLIKGGGGALFREKIVASSAEQFIVIADRSKRVAKLGAFALPVEIEKFAFALTVRKIRNTLVAHGLGDAALTLRSRDGDSVLSDGGNYVLDCALGRIDDPVALDKSLKAISGVIETGLFCGLAHMVIYGDENGATTEMRR